MKHAAPVVVLFILACPVAGQDVEAGGREMITIRGIVGVSAFVQDALFGPGNGQKAQFVQTELDEDGWWHGGDVRNTRLTLAFAGPEVLDDWRANAVVEMDFFGPFAAGGAFGDEQPLPRLRLAWAEMTNGRTTVRFGQDFALTWGNVPVSTSRIGFPLGWGTGGLIGWRFLGLQLHHTLTGRRARTTAQIRLAIFENSWVDEPNPPPPGAVPSADDGPSAGEAGVPQLEARFDLGGRLGRDGTWGAYVVGHYDSKDLDGAGSDDDTVDDLTSWAAQAGARFASGALTLHGNAWFGKAMGHHFGNILQFRDVEGWGGWVQAGVNFTDELSLWGYAGTDDPDDEDEAGAPLERQRSVLLVPMVRWQLRQLAFGLEWVHSRTDWAAAPAERSGNQVVLSGVYTF